MYMTLQEIVTATGAVGDLDRPDLPVAGVQTDSRTVRPGDLFVCLEGEHLDGHNFVLEAGAKGAAAILAQRPLAALPPGVQVLIVPDSLRALGDLARHWRRRFKGVVVAVTGSAGKTTTKELLAGILSGYGLTAKSYKNWNNSLGLPLNILGFSGEEAYWVLEIGVSEIGEMAILADISAPDLAVLVNVLPAHLEGLLDLKTIVKEKLVLCDRLAKAGGLVLSLDYASLVHRAASKVCSKTYFSTRAGQAPYWCCPIKDPEGQADFQLSCAGATGELQLPWAADYMAENIAAACAAGHRLGLSLEEILPGLEAVQLPEHRGQHLQLPRAEVIDDTYNANPQSMARAIAAAARQAGKRPLVLILGGMAELGAQTEEAHFQLGRQAGLAAPAALFFQGPYFQAARSGLRQVSKVVPLYHLQGPRDLAAAWQGLDLQDPVVLLKGSRCERMEDYIEFFNKEPGT